MLQGCRSSGLLYAFFLVVSGAALAENMPCEQSTIDKVELISPKTGYFQVEVDYCYKPDTREPVFLVLALDAPEGFEVYSHSFPVEAMPGRHSVTLELNRPNEPEGAFSTYKLNAQMSEGARIIVAERREQRIDWPSMATYQRQRMFARYSNDELLEFAEERIDEGSVGAVQVAREYLEKVVLEEPERVEVYKQFARIAMAQQANEQGLREAESHLNTALQIDPQYADGYILRGFVLANLRRFDESESDFRKAESLGVKNLWLWNNWARKQWLQGNKKETLDLYRRTLAGERPTGRNLRARQNAFEFLLIHLEDDLSVDELEALHQQRLREFDSQSCLYTEYAAFLLRQRHDYPKAILNGHKSLDGGCRDVAARGTLGLAYYLGSLEQPEMLGRARVFLPEGPLLYWELARLPEGEPLLQRYRKQIDTPDGGGYTALAYALVKGNVEAARRLREQGASLEHEIGTEKLPLILLPIFHDSADGVRFLIEQGVDYSQITYRGIPATSYAAQRGNEEILGLLESARKI